MLERPGHKPNIGGIHDGQALGLKGGTALLKLAR